MGYKKFQPTIELRHCCKEYEDERQVQKTLGVDILLEIINYESISDKIVYRLISQKLNKERLKNMPHTIVEDLAKIYILPINYNIEDTAFILITDSLMKEWKVNLKELNGKADINTPNLFPPSIKGMNEVIRELMDNDFTEYTEAKKSFPKNLDKDFIKLLKRERREETMYVLSNTNGINGAGALLYPGILRDLTISMNLERLYILPSSIHEVILLPGKKSFDKKTLKDIVMDVNRSQVSTDEILSDEVYYYDLKTDGITILEK